MLCVASSSDHTEITQLTSNVCGVWTEFGDLLNVLFFSDFSAHLFCFSLTSVICEAGCECQLLITKIFYLKHRNHV